MPTDIDLRATLKRFGFPTAASVFLPNTKATDFQFKAWCVFNMHGTFIDLNGRAFSAPKTMTQRRYAE